MREGWGFRLSDTNHSQLMCIAIEGPSLDEFMLGKQGYITNVVHCRLLSFCGKIYIGEQMIVSIIGSGWICEAVLYTTLTLLHLV